MNQPITPNGKRILFAAVPADGHINPLTGIAKFLQSNGFDVRWYTSISYAEKLKQMEIPHYTFKKAMEVTASNVDELFPERSKIKNSIKKLNYDLKNFFILRSTEYLDDMQEIYKSFPFDLLIADCLFTAIPLVKEYMKIPVIAVGIVPVMEESKDLGPSGLGLIPASSMIGKWKHSLLRVLAKKFLFSKSNKLMHDILNSYGVFADDVFLFDMVSKKSDLLLQIGTPGFEYYRSDLSRNIRFIGALLPWLKTKNHKPWYDERLNRYSKVVLVTQGTVEKDVTKIITPALEAYKGTDTLVICTTGGSQTDELRKKYPYENIIIEDFIAFNDVMPYADVYVTNGGYGGVTLGIQNRLPLVVAGLHEGKNEICARIGYFKYGIDLKTETPETAQLKAAVEEVLNNPVYKQNIHCLANEFEQYNANELSLKYVNEVLRKATGKIISESSTKAVY
jgi:UDP:flavonoid glycosyltransferase YjiC (YdhE family)